MLTIIADHVFDGITFSHEPVRIDLEGGVISSIRSLESAGTDQLHVLDARGGTVIPGLINTHTHVARAGMFRTNEPFSPFQVAKNLSQALAAGVTTVGEMGCTGGLVGSLREHINRHPDAGPCILAAGPLLTAPGGYPLDWLPPLSARLGAALPCSNDVEAKRAVHLVQRMEMDFVKLAIMHRSYAERPIPVLSEEAAKAAVTEAKALGLKVLCHAHYLADYLLALKIGVDALMHSTFEPLDSETVRRIRDSGIPVCPTLWVFESALIGAEQRLDRDPRYTRHVSPAVRRDWTLFCDKYATSGEVMPETIVAAGLPKARAREAVRNAARNLVILRDAGVPIVFGTDASYGFSLLCRPVDELKAMERAGLSLAECMQAATTRAASLLGLKDRGTLRPGMRADIVVLDSKLEAGLTALDHLREVIVAGRRLTTISPATKALSKARTIAAILQGIGSTLYWSSFAKIRSAQ